MNAQLLTKTYKVVVAGTLALGLVAALSSYAAGPIERPVTSPSPTATVPPR